MEERDFTVEFKFITSRSSGSGGQNVNKVNTKVELRFDVLNSSILTQEEKRILVEKLANKITTEGILQIVSQEDRTQLKNKEKCIEKFYELISKALTKPKLRKKVKLSRTLIEKRLEKKKKLSEKKEMRKKDFDIQ